MFSKIIKSIPNTITTLNLLSGVMAIIFAFHFGQEIGALKGYQWAFICIGCAAIFDFCDGASARLLKAYSPIGAELDSLADLVSFGVAPAMLVFNIINIANEVEFTPWSLIALLIPAMGALRLARFNVDTRQTTSFIGLPIPAGAIFWIGLVDWFMVSGYRGNWVALILVAGMSLMMVSNMNLFSLKVKNFHLLENIKQYFIILAAIVLVALCGLSGLMWTIFVYILISPIEITVEVEGNEPEI